MIEYLYSQNPWWKNPELIKIDPDYNEWMNSPIKWVPKFINKLSLKPFSLNFLIGPRQVGKTTAIKILISKLLNENPSESIFYFTCELLKDYRDLYEILRKYIYEIKKPFGIEKSYIFLDEVSFVNEWWRTIKYMIDRNYFKNDVVTITGSTSPKIKGEIELFPGRRGYGRDVIAYPLTFKEYISILNSDLNLKSTLNLNELDKIMRYNFKYIEELQMLFKSYIITGGFPIPIKTYFEKRMLEERIFKTYLTWIENDILKADRNLIYAKQLISSIILKAPSALSYDSIAKDTDIKSHKTVASYIETFRKMYIMELLYHYDPFKGRPIYRREKKVIIIDPFIANALSKWTLTKIKYEALMEWIVQSHLKKFFHETYYYRNSRFEINTLIKFEDKTFGFEVKLKKRKIRIPNWIDKLYLISEDEIPPSILMASIG